MRPSPRLWGWLGPLDPVLGAGELVSPGFEAVFGEEGVPVVSVADRGVGVEEPASFFLPGEAREFWRPG